MAHRVSLRNPWDLWEVFSQVVYVWNNSQMSSSIRLKAFATLLSASILRRSHGQLFFLKSFSKISWRLLRSSWEVIPLTDNSCRRFFCSFSCWIYFMYIKFQMSSLIARKSSFVHRHIRKDISHVSNAKKGIWGPFIPRKIFINFFSKHWSYSPLHQHRKHLRTKKNPSELF